MSTILTKLSSRKLWLALAGVATGIALALGVDASDITTIAGAVMALVSVVTYIVTEGKIDAAAVGNAVQAAQEAVEIIQAEDSAAKTETTAETAAATEQVTAGLGKADG